MTKTFNCRILIFLTLVNSIVGCKKQDDTKSSTSCKIICSGGESCTDQFETISVRIETSDMAPLKLDRYYTIREEGSILIDMQTSATVTEDSIRKAIGRYPILNDTRMSLTDRCGKVFYFVGRKDSVEILKERYVISNDCCHILLDTGRLEIVR